MAPLELSCSKFLCVDFFHKNQIKCILFSIFLIFYRDFDSKNAVTNHLYLLFYLCVNDRSLSIHGHLKTFDGFQSASFAQVSFFHFFF